MASKDKTTHDARVLFLTWIGLVCLTLGSFWLASSSMAAATATTTAATTVGLLGLAAMKGLLIVSVFMEMRHGPLVWAAAMGGFLLAEAALIVAILP